jgi:hypothetical protein
MRDLNIGALSPRLALLTAGSGAIASADEGDITLFEDALAAPSAGHSISLAYSSPTANGYGERAS